MPRPVCLVSGSSSGIGAATVAEFAARGYDIALNYNSGQERAEAIAVQLRQEHGVEVLTLEADLSQTEAPFSLVDQTFSHFGRLDVAISNSGVSNLLRDAQGQVVRYRFHETPTDHLDREMERVLSLNLLGAYRLVQRSLKHMFDLAQTELQAGGQPRHRSILLISSISDVAPDSTRIPYGVSKAGLNHVVLGAAFEGGPYNITVNALRPGVVDTPITTRPSGIMNEEKGRQYTVAEIYDLMALGGSQPIRRIGKAEEIAAAAYAFTHLPYMTGQLIAVDGGFTLSSGFPNRELYLQEGLRRRREGQS
jgi:NAD(P)-dependent dehydrogenase (short-subunit alcohol dehydrogenase family)